MKGLLPVILSVLICCVCLSAGAKGNSDKTCKIKDLSWLAGSWITQSKESEFEECWMAPSGGIMVGMGRKTKSRLLFNCTGRKMFQAAPETSVQVDPTSGF